MERSKSGGVQITRVVSRDQGIRSNHDDQDRDSIDDSDGSDLSLTPGCNGFMTIKDYNAEVFSLDDSKHDCIASDHHQASNGVKNPSFVTCSSAEDGSRLETQSRFRVVKVDSHVPSLKKKGRWTCKSFQEQNAADKGDRQSTTTEDAAVGSLINVSQQNIDSKEQDDKYCNTFSYFDMTKVNASAMHPKSSTMSQPYPINNEKALIGKDNDASSITVQELVRSETNNLLSGNYSPATNNPIISTPPVDSSNKERHLISHSAAPDNQISDGTVVGSPRKVAATNQSSVLAKGTQQSVAQDLVRPIQPNVEQAGVGGQSSPASVPAVKSQVSAAFVTPNQSSTTTNGSDTPTIHTSSVPQTTHVPNNDSSQSMSSHSDKSVPPSAVPPKVNLQQHAGRHMDMPKAAALAAAALTHISIATNMQLPSSAYMLTSPVDRPRANSMFTNAVLSENIAGIAASDLLHPDTVQTLLRKGSMSGVSGLSHALPLLPPNSTSLKTRAEQADQSMRRYVEHLSLDARNSRNMATQSLFSHTGDLTSVVALMHAQQKLDDVVAAANDSENRAVLRQTSTPVVGSATVIEEAGASSHIVTSQSATDVTAVSER